MKIKICEVLLVSENINDFRINIRFESSETKNTIYMKMNSIKSNPIKFIN